MGRGRDSAGSGGVGLIRNSELRKRIIVMVRNLPFALATNWGAPLAGIAKSFLKIPIHKDLKICYCLLEFF